MVYSFDGPQWEHTRKRRMQRGTQQMNNIDFMVGCHFLSSCQRVDANQPRASDPRHMVLGSNSGSKVQGTDEPLFPYPGGRPRPAPFFFMLATFYIHTYIPCPISRGCRVDRTRTRRPPGEIGKRVPSERIRASTVSSSSSKGGQGGQGAGS